MAGENPKETDRRHLTGEFMPNLAMKIYNSTLIQIVITLFIYSLYATVIGISLFPSFLALIWASNTFIAPYWAAGWTHIPFINWFFCALCCGAAVYLYFITGSIFMSTLIRLLSLGIKPGKYSLVSFTTLRWLIYSGIFTIAYRSILPMIPISFFSTLFFRIVGAKIGKNVYLNTYFISDAYFLTLEDGVVLGGNAEITCHLVENNHLILTPITIGKDSLIGSGAYISPGVTIGEKCTIGARVYLRRGKNIPNHTVITSFAGVSMRQASAIDQLTKKYT
jgi:acetyltransferase-like isoleucine patch superfamily enzyme